MSMIKSKTNKTFITCRPLMIMLVFISGCASVDPKTNSIAESATQDSALTSKPDVIDQIESQDESTTQGDVLTSGPEVIDQFELVGEVYNVVIDDITNIDETTALEASIDRIGGYLDVKISVYNENNAEYTPKLARAILLMTSPVCTRISQSSRSYILSLEPGFRIHMGADNGYAVEGSLSDDKKTYRGGCKVSYLLDKP